MARKKKTRKKFRKLEDLAIYCGKDLTQEYEVDPIALGVLKWLKRRISSRLWKMLRNMMLGFDDEMQLEIANDLWDFACGHIIRTTGCASVDTVLIYSYKLIAKEQGFRMRDIDKVLKNAM
jgi:hypothetical protein